MIDQITMSWTNGQKKQAYDQFKASDLGALELCREAEGYLSTDDILKMLTFFLYVSNKEAECLKA